MKANIVSTSDLLGGWLAELESGQPPPKYRLPPPFDGMDLRPGMLAVFAGQPGAGKTAALLQLTVEMLRMNSGARVLIANVEMKPQCLLERIASRLSGVSLKLLMDRTLTEEEMQRVRIGVNTLRQVADRLTFLQEPYTLAHMAAAADAVSANVMVADYLQRISVDGERSEERAGINAVMDKLRTFCGQDALLLAVSALSRGSSPGGSTYQNAGMANLRGSSELEYGADCVYILQRSEEASVVTFHNPKQRNGSCDDIPMIFDGSLQSFSPYDELAAFDAAKCAPPRRTKGESKA